MMRIKKEATMTSLKAAYKISVLKRKFRQMLELQIKKIINAIQEIGKAKKRNNMSFSTCKTLILVRKIKVIATNSKKQGLRGQISNVVAQNLKL
jgi:hypothetical protein